MKKRRLSVWLLTNAPSPYQMEYLAALAKHMDLDVRLMRHAYADAAWAGGAMPPEAHVMRGWGSERHRDELRLHPSALTEVWRGAHDVYVLSGVYTSPTFLMCAWILHWRRKPWAVWFERPWPEEYRPAWARRASARSGLARMIRKRVLRLILGRATRVFCIGSAAVNAYREWGVPENKLVFLPYVCDLEPFRSCRISEGDHIRFLYVGLLDQRKGVDLLLDAFERLADEYAQVELILAGCGPVKKGCEGRRTARVRFAGHVEREELPALYGSADVFVFPTRYDGWGVVLNEACGAGLPVIVTSAAGATADLVEDGVNGIVINRDDPEGLYQAMKYMVDHPESREAFGKRSLEKSSVVDMAPGVDRFLHAVEDMAG